jgi:ferredoxin
MTGPGETLWQAMQAAAVPWPVSCRNGSCRACMGVLRSGAVRYTVEWPGLLPEEKAQGCVLPCVACASTDVVLASA